jgi:glycerophosphoryl diester phosphodiesterase
MVYLDEQQFRAVAAAARRARIRLCANTLTSVGVISVIGLGGDEDALRDPSTWRVLLSDGVSMIQTDEPAVLQNYLRSVGAQR